MTFYSSSGNSGCSSWAGSTEEVNGEKVVQRNRLKKDFDEQRAKGHTDGKLWVE